MTWKYFRSSTSSSASNYNLLSIVEQSSKQISKYIIYELIVPLIEIIQLFSSYYFHFVEIIL